MSERIMPAYVKLAEVHRLFMPTAKRQTVTQRLDELGVIERIGKGHPLVDTAALRRALPKVWRLLANPEHVED